MEIMCPPKADLQTALDDRTLAQEIRRGLITIARALAKRYSWGKVMLMVLGVE